jgi:isoquinoline 1-oxidoreductase beta subunit
MSQPNKLTRSKSRASDASVDRRRFVAGAAGLAGFFIAPLGLRALGAPAQARDASAYALTDWVKIFTDGRIVIGLSQPEVGQGVYTGLPQVVAGELDADWKDVSVEFVFGKPSYGMSINGEPPAQFIAGSLSTTLLYDRLRIGGAAARAALVAAAAARWQISPQLCETHASRVLDPSTGREFGYGEVAEEAAGHLLTSEPRLKTTDQHSLIGKSLRRLDTPAKVDGSAVFGIDVKLPNMLTGAVRMAPTFGGKIIRIKNEASVSQMPGVRGVVKTEDSVVVAADTFWQAKQGVEALDIDFDKGPNGNFSSADIVKAWNAALNSEEAVVAVDRGNVLEKFQGQGHVFEREYTAPYTAHAPLEPVNLTVDPTGEVIQVFGSVQNPDLARTLVAKVFGRSREKVNVSCTFIGGSFGRKGCPDFMLQTATAAKALGRPIKLLRTREVDIQHDVFRTGAACRIKALLDSAGYPSAIQVRVVGQSFFKKLKPAWVEKRGGWDESMVECIHNQRYNFPSFRVEVVDTPQPIPLWFMRSVGSTAGAFFWESFIGELADEAGVDGYLYRRNMLAHEPLGLGVLDAVAKAADWGRAPAGGIQRSIAYAAYPGRGGAFVTHAAHVIEVEKSHFGIVIKRVFCAMDCGKVVNPNLVRAQIEGGIGFALTNSLKSKITFANGGVEQSNFIDYPLLQLAEMPEVIAIIVESDRPPQGAGEPAMPPVAPALANAIAKATGKHHRSLPFQV